MSGRRAAAAGSLALGFGALALAVVVAVQAFPRGLLALVLVALGAAAIWHGALHVGAMRAAGLALGVPAVAAGLAVVVGHRLLEEALVVGALLVSSALARIAFTRRAHLPPQPRPQRPVLLYNPKSGGGKARRLRLA